MPLGNGLKAASSGRVLSLELERSLAPPKPQRLSDSLISQLMRRAWSSIFSTPQILEPTLELINVLADQRVRDHQEHLDLLTTIDHRIAVVIDYIDANCVNSLTVAKLAKMACMSPSRLSVRFKAATGETVWGYFQRRRCEKAHQLLSETSASVSDIAYQVGFSSQAHFTQSFKRRFNTTPGRFRQNAKK
ncbi:transcriptional regulator, AraC family, putative (plasmid) [Roseobacter denitrificans OCh 114]|uniref:Transcriptional regulator, AraC family, putative n=1 Tax=Roseobacter denitrificans (strain ATCC 33942 / OCh 114) TaxID=375451 RepID=Q07GK0_ROSDO|nr:transcriptional regulator, AraC family, putative [Roseobacter denitrificans OCh 114]